MAQKNWRKHLPKGIAIDRGKFRIQFKVQGTPRVRRRTDFEASEEKLPAAMALLEQYKREALLGAHERQKPILLSEACDRFCAFSATENKPSTYAYHRNKLASIRAFFKGRRLESITAGDLLDYIQWRREYGITDVTIRHNLLTLSRVFQYAQSHRWIAANPVRSISVPSDAESRNEYILTAEDERAYLAVAASWPDLHDLAALMLNQGLRPDCEILQIRSEHIDFERARLYVPRSKSKASERSLALTTESLQILGRRVREDTPWLFSSPVRPERRRSYSGLVNLHNRALARCGLSFDIYSLRHTFATRFYDSTKDVYALAQVLGHADLKTVQRYVTRTQERMDEAMSVFEARQPRLRPTVQ